MSTILLITGIVFVAIVMIAIAWFIRRRLKRSINPRQFSKCWKDLQKQCATRKTWPLAIIDADNLLDEALKKRGYKGHTVGERLVAAQHDLTDNESVWFGHKYRMQITDKDVRTLKKQDVLDALTGFRQALRDLGVLR